MNSFNRELHHGCVGQFGGGGCVSQFLCFYEILLLSALSLQMEEKHKNIPKEW